MFDLPAGWDGPGEVSGLRTYVETAKPFGSGLEAYSIFIDGVHVAQYGEFTDPEDIGVPLSHYNPSPLHVGNMFAMHAPATT